MANPFKSKLMQNKKGATSLYVVVFTSLLFGVITLSFIRFVLSEANQTSNDDLSRSAYDAAMAGVEDAKTAVNRYYNCLGKSGETPDSCGWDTLFNDDDCTNGIGLANYLYPGNYSGGEVLIQQNAPNSTVDNASDQAYTCVVISDKVPDYRGTLTSDTRTKVVPLRVYDGSNSNGDIIKKIKFQWYSSLNEGANDPNDPDKGFKVTDPNLQFRDNDHKTVPPTIQLTYIKVNQGINIKKFHQANSDGYEYSTMVILPSATSENGVPLPIDFEARRDAGNISAGNNNTPFGVDCSTTADFACTVELTDTNINQTDTAFLIVSLPYKETVSDFAVTLIGDSDKVIDFEGVQVSVDSTGRTNNLVRRVETRLDPADLFFPYPQYALELSGDDGYVLSKNFWITANCWYSQPSTNGSANQCPNNGTVGS